MGEGREGECHNTHTPHTSILCLRLVFKENVVGQKNKTKQNKKDRYFVVGQISIIGKRKLDKDKKRENKNISRINIRVWCVLCKTYWADSIRA